MQRSCVCFFNEYSIPVGFGVCDDTARDDFNEIKNSLFVHIHRPIVLMYSV